MGFLGFLKKSKVKKSAVPKELGISPTPTMEELPEELPTFPTPEEIPKELHKDLPEELPSELPEDLPKELSEIEAGLKEELPEEELASFAKEEERRAYEIEKEELEEKVPVKPIFVKADLFKGVIDEISSIRRKLKEVDDASTTLADLENDEQREFERWHIILEDIQKKLIFTDKSLFDREI